MIKRINIRKAYTRDTSQSIVLIQGDSGRYIPFVSAESVTNGLGVRLDAQFPLAQEIMDLKIELNEALRKGEA